MLMKKEVMTAVIEKSALSKAAEPIMRQTIPIDYTVLHIYIIFPSYIILGPAVIGMLNSCGDAAFVQAKQNKYNCLIIACTTRRYDACLHVV